MKYTVEFKCGHEEEVELVGAYKDRERKIEYLKTCKCSECKKAELRAKMAETHDEVRMHYSEYKNNYSDCKTLDNSYDAKTKTIVVFVERKVEEVVEEVVEETAAEYEVSFNNTTIVKTTSAKEAYDAYMTKREELVASNKMNDILKIKTQKNGAKIKKSELEAEAAAEETTVAAEETKEDDNMLKIETKEQLQAIAEAFAEVEEYRIKESLEDTGLEEADLEAYTEMLNDIIEFDNELHSIARDTLM